MTKPNVQRQFDLLYAPNNVFEGNIKKYILRGVDAASRYKVVREFQTKKASKVSFVLKAIYKNGDVFKYQEVFQCDNRP